MAAGGGRVWVVNAARTVSVIDPVHNTVIGTATHVDAGALALDGSNAWVIDAGPAITRIDDTGAVRQQIKVPAISLSSLVIADGAAWAVDPYGGLLYRVELHGQHVVTTVRIGPGAEAIAAGPGEQTLAQRVRAVWPALLGEESRVLDQAIGLMMYDPVRYADLGRGASQQYLPPLLSICPQDWPEQRKLEVCEMILASLRGFLIDWLVSGDMTGVEAGFEALARALEREEAAPE